ncbi:ammonium transporter [Planktothrix mougeotii]|uniref:Ammonium transporter n=1 Tax=Planktothrix mougeotii LEGE 06226 TaxID=1828728 RepID=A0ABR9UE40_9CYAN|nr:ammonium transporter [Planktothrix mougeotii]MBE9144729.1 ammonium transporter [Planktothrix mougeotii LEGE 06226]
MSLSFDYPLLNFKNITFSVEEQGLDIDQHGEEAYGEDLASGLSFITETFAGKEG